MAKITELTEGYFYLADAVNGRTASTLKGQGIGATVVYQTVGAKNGLLFSNCDWCTISDMHIDGKKATIDSQYGIYVSGGYNILTNLKLTNWNATGLLITGGSVSVSGNRLSNSTVDLSNFASVIVDTPDTMITHCEISRANDALRITKNGNGQFFQVHAWDGYDQNFKIDNASNCLFVGCTSDRGGGHGFKILSTTDDIKSIMIRDGWLWGANGNNSSSREISIQSDVGRTIDNVTVMGNTFDPWVTAHAFDLYGVYEEDGAGAITNTFVAANTFVPGGFTNPVRFRAGAPSSIAVANKGYVQDSYIPVVPTTFDVPGGSVGYIDTDCTSVLPSSGSYLVFGEHYPENGQNIGARAVGSSVDVKSSASAWVWHSFNALSTNGHLELYREAANNHYRMLGYQRQI